MGIKRLWEISLILSIKLNRVLTPQTQYVLISSNQARIVLHDMNKR